jgi:hypothetical protein
MNTSNWSSQLSIAKQSKNNTPNTDKVNILVYLDNLRSICRVLNNYIQKGIVLNKN